MFKPFALTLLFSLTLASVSNPCNMVAFRIDDIQSYWLTDTQKAVMDVFQSQQIPLTAGVIAHDFYDGDPTMVNYIKAGLQNPNWDLEVANHGYIHEAFILYSEEEQYQLLSNGAAETIMLLSPYLDSITTFMPPYNEWNADTLSAMKRAGYNLISGATDDDTEYPGNDPTLLHFPVGSATTDLSDSYKITAEESFALIQDQMASHGMSAVMMHFVEFTVDGQTDINAINDLKKLIQMCKDAGYQLTNLRGLANHCAGQQQPQATTGKATTGRPATVTTGRSASVTTGRSASVTTGRPASVTTGRSASVATGRVVSATTGGQQPSMTTGNAVPSSSGTTGISSTTCTLGEQRCSGTNTYQTCGWATRTQAGWLANQSCQAGLTCQSVQGNQIWCV